MSLLGYRKLLVAVSAMITSTVLLVRGDIDPVTWQVVVATVLGAHAVGNGMEHLRSGRGERNNG